MRIAALANPALHFPWVPQASLAEPPPRLEAAVDPLFGRLRNRYILFRPGETIFEAADMVDSNPINKGVRERGLTNEGRQQVLRSVEALRNLGVDSPTIWYDNGARATQTADIIGRELSVPRARMEPEFRWLEARGLGALDGTPLREASVRVRALDALDIDNRPDETNDATPSDSVNDVFSRMRNTVLKIENSYSGGDFVIVPGDYTVLSVFAAAACGVDLREHGRFELRPGEFYDLRELTRDVRAGRFEPMQQRVLTEREVAQGREAIREIGPKIFSETEAGSWVLGPGVLR